MFSVAYALRALWVMAILPIVIVFMPFPKLSWLQEVLTVFSRRGKTVLQSSSRKFSVPQKYFCHFYVLGVAWTTLLLIGTCLCAFATGPVVAESLYLPSIASQLAGASGQSPLPKLLASTVEHKKGIWNSVFLLLLMETQVLRRLFESLYVFKYSPSARMHIVGYLIGLTFYTAAPLSLCCEHIPEVVKFVVNGYAEFTIKDFVNPLMHLRWYAWIGAACFTWGWIHQRHCHGILGSLRKNGSQDEQYVIPSGDWFNYVSSPHYLAEIIIYGGFVIATGFSDVTILLLLALWWGILGWQPKIHTTGTYVNLKIIPRIALQSYLLFIDSCLAFTLKS